MEREKEREIGAAKIDLADVHGESVSGGQTAKVRRRAMVIKCRKTLVPDRGREHGMKDLAFQMLGKKQIEPREHGVPRRQEDQSRTPRLEYAGDSCNSRRPLPDVFEESLANHQIRIRPPPAWPDGA